MREREKGGEREEVECARKERKKKEEVERKNAKECRTPTVGFFHNSNFRKKERFRYLNTSLLARLKAEAVPYSGQYNQH